MHRGCRGEQQHVPAVKWNHQINLFQHQLWKHILALKMENTENGDWTPGFIKAICNSIILTPQREEKTFLLLSSELPEASTHCRGGIKMMNLKQKQEKNQQPLQLGAVWLPGYHHQLQNVTRSWCWHAGFVSRGFRRSQGTRSCCRLPFQFCCSHRNWSCSSSSCSFLTNTSYQKSVVLEERQVPQKLLAWKQLPVWMRPWFLQRGCS